MLALSTGGGGLFPVNHECMRQWRYARKEKCLRKFPAEVTSVLRAKESLEKKKEALGKYQRLRGGVTLVRTLDSNWLSEKICARVGGLEKLNDNSGVSTVLDGSQQRFLHRAAASFYFLTMVGC